MRYWLASWLLLLAGVGDAQELTALDGVALANFVDSTPLTSSELADPVVAEIDHELTRFKRQALQSVSVGGGLLADLHGDELNSSFFEAGIGSGIPLGSFDNIVAVTPRVRIDWIDSRADIDVPKELYLFETQFFYRRPINERLSAMAIFSPSIRSDLSTSDRAFRVFALGLLNWKCIPDRLTLSGGAVYLGRADLPVLPAVGLTWTPHSRTKLDLRFPTSRLSYRLKKNGRKSEKWMYFGIGIGGNTWAVTRADGTTDELSLRDLSLTAGFERLLDGGGGWFVESGFALNRRLEFERLETNTELGDGIMFRAGWRY